MTETLNTISLRVAKLLKSGDALRLSKPSRIRYSLSAIAKDILARRSQHLKRISRRRHIQRMCALALFASATARVLQVLLPIRKMDLHQKKNESDWLALHDMNLYSLTTTAKGIKPKSQHQVVLRSASLSHHVLNTCSPSRRASPWWRGGPPTRCTCPSRPCRSPGRSRGACPAQP